MTQSCIQIRYLFLDSKRSEECISFIIICVRAFFLFFSFCKYVYTFLGRRNAQIFNIKGRFWWQIGCTYIIHFEGHFSKFFLIKIWHGKNNEKVYDTMIFIKIYLFFVTQRGIIVEIFDFYRKLILATITTKRDITFKLYNKF